MTSRLYPSAISSFILIKWAHVQSESMASITTKSPPTKVIKAEPLSPDHNSLCKAMRVSGEANLDTMQCMSLFNALFIAHLIILLLYQVFKNTFYQTNFYPIPTFPIKCILKNPDLYVFDLDPKKKVMVLHPGQLWFSSSNTFVGAGAFKTAYTATLVLSCLKQPYLHHVNQPLSGLFKCMDTKEESKKIFCEVNVLYWVKALFKLTEDLIAQKIAKACEPPPFAIPSIQFVEAGLAIFYATNPRGAKVTVNNTYLCEELIPDANMVFTKFIHNGNCVPLVEPGETEYEVAQFLAFTQHI